MNNKKSYRDKLKDCKEAGNIEVDKCVWCNRSILICKKYHQQCCSTNCKSERKGENSNSK